MYLSDFDIHLQQNGKLAQNINQGLQLILVLDDSLPMKRTWTFTS